MAFAYCCLGSHLSSRKKSICLFPLSLRRYTCCHSSSAISTSSPWYRHVLSRHPFCSSGSIFRPFSLASQNAILKFCHPLSLHTLLRVSTRLSLSTVSFFFLLLRTKIGPFFAVILNGNGRFIFPNVCVSASFYPNNKNLATLFISNFF